jgi:hypothetical protein
MPGKGPRIIRALICNPLEMKYTQEQSGVFQAKERERDSIGAHLSS